MAARRTRPDVARPHEPPYSRLGGVLRGAARRVLVGLLVVVLAVALAIATDLTLRRPAERPGDPAPVEPAEVAAPEGLDLPPIGEADPVALPAEGRPLAAAAVRRALLPALGDPDLGPRVLAAVEPLDRGRAQQVVGRPGAVAIPASTTKLVTAAAALLAMGPERTFTTRVVATGRARTPRLVLVGGGDPFLAGRPDEPGAYPPRADVVTLARSTARALRADGVRRVSLDVDDSLFSGPALSPRWPDTYVPDVVSPIHALWVDEGADPDGTGRVADPALSAGATFAQALRARSIDVRGEVARRVAPAGARPVAEVSGAPLSAVVERVLLVSDNEAAEVLLRHVGLEVAGDGSFQGGQEATRSVLRRVGVDLADPVVLYDGSGLSRENRIDPATLLAVLRAAASPEHPQLRPVLTGLPVAGYAGSLSERFDTGDPEALGRVRAKTGTLSNVFALAGLAVGADGTPMLFAMLADRIDLVDTLGALEAMDEAAAELGACRCGR